MHIQNLLMHIRSLLMHIRNLLTKIAKVCYALPQAEAQEQCALPAKQKALPPLGKCAIFIYVPLED